MSIEDRLSESLARNLDQLDVPAGDVGVARRMGDRQRRQRTWTTGLAAAAALAVVATGVTVARSGDDDGRLDPAPATGTWTRLPDAPLSPRTGGIAVWTGTEALFFGGEIDHICPPNASCVSDSTRAKDGAAYDPESRTWRTIAPAPVTVGAHTPHALVGGTLVVIGDDRTWHAYDVGQDRWRDLPKLPVTLHSGGLSALDGRVYALGRDAVHVLDVERGQWSTLPGSPHEPRIEPQEVSATPEGIVVLGLDSTATNDGTVPSYVFAEVYTEERGWRRLERSDVLGGWGPWHWTGTRLVSPNLECFDGGEVNGYGRCIPSGGTLDPASGIWEPLSDLPAPGSGGWSLNGAGGPLMLSWGYAYDDSARTWTRISQPNGAPNYSVAAVVADGTVIALGGLDPDKGWDKDALSNRAWSWTP